MTWCSDYLNTQLKFDLDNVCTGKPILKDIKIGDKTLIGKFNETEDCGKIDLVGEGECINQISFFGDQYSGISGMGYWTNLGNKGAFGEYPNSGVGKPVSLGKCGEGYYSRPGMQYTSKNYTTSGFFTTIYDHNITGRGDGEKVSTCDACGDLCTADEKCKSYECSPKTL
jgi:hypothetical protein